MSRSTHLNKAEEKKKRGMETGESESDALGFVFINPIRGWDVVCCSSNRF